MALRTSLVAPDALDPDRLALLAAAAAEMATWRPGSHRFGHYSELTRGGPAICRTENVSACRPEVAELVDGPLRAIASEQLGVEVEAFKVKLNYKHPGGAGFRPHQDQTAYPGAPPVVSLLIAIDACTRESGCLWIAPEVDRELPTDDRGVVRRDVADALTWEAVTLAPGDALVIPGSAPHWSGSNRTERPRRVLVASYAERGRGYSRAVYYAARQLRMEESTARDGRFRISTHADFAGTEVPPDVRTTDHCTHP